MSVACPRAGVSRLSATAVSSLSECRLSSDWQPRRVGGQGVKKVSWRCQPAGRCRCCCHCYCCYYIVSPMSLLLLLLHCVTDVTATVATTLYHWCHCYWCYYIVSLMSLLLVLLHCVTDVTATVATTLSQWCHCYWCWCHYYCCYCSCCHCYCCYCIVSVMSPYWQCQWCDVTDVTLLTDRTDHCLQPGKPNSELREFGHLLKLATPDAFYKSKCPSVCPSVCPPVCPSVRLFTFEVPFNGLFAPTSRSRMSNIFRDSESLGKSGLSFEHFCLEMV